MAGRQFVERPGSVLGAAVLGSEAVLTSLKAMSKSFGKSWGLALDKWVDRSGRVGCSGISYGDSHISHSKRPLKIMAYQAVSAYEDRDSLYRQGARR
jgi:hypothetical protein